MKVIYSFHMKIYLTVLLLNTCYTFSGLE